MKHLLSVLRTFLIFRILPTSLPALFAAVFFCAFAPPLFCAADKVKEALAEPKGLGIAKQLANVAPNLNIANIRGTLAPKRSYQAILHSFNSR
jgi:hypothetical protein